MLRAFFAAAVLLLTTSCAGLSQSLQPVEGGPEPVALRLERLETQSAENARLLENIELLELSTELQRMREELRELRGMVEMAGHTTAQSSERQRSLFMDLDKRLQALETAGPVVAAQPGATAAGETPAVDNSKVVEKAYLDAFDVLKSGDYAGAIKAFDGYLSQYPDSRYAANANYWMGESYYVQENFTAARKAFETVVDKFSTSPKVPDALLKLGFVKYEQKDYVQARATLESLINRFPDTSAAKLAGQRLERMKREGV